MRTGYFVFGFVSGVVAYHYFVVSGTNQELVTELRGAIKKLDDRLAETEKQKGVPNPDSPDTPTSPFTPTSEDPA